VVLAVPAVVWLAAAPVRVVFAVDQCVLDSLLMHSQLLVLAVPLGMPVTLSRGILILILQAVNGVFLMAMP